MASMTESRRKDPTWKYTVLLDPKNTNDHKCPFCLKVTHAGITRQKEHLIGTKRKKKNVKRCENVPPEVKEEIEEYQRMLEENQKKKLMESYVPDFDDGEDMLEVEGDEYVEEIGSSNASKGKATMSKGVSVATKSSTISRGYWTHSGEIRKKKGPMDTFVTPDPALEVAKDDRRRKLRQKSVLESVDKEMVAKVHQDIARFWYQAGIAFNVAHLKSFRVMLKSVGLFGPHLPPPTYHALRVPLLEKELNYTKKLMEEHKAVWMSKGCSFMTDGWIDRTSRTLINFLVNSPRGTVFIKSIDASADIKTGEKMVEILEDQLKELDKEIGIENVIQVITDNASNLKYAGEKLEERYKLYWTSCAAHCLNLMLKDLAKIAQVRRALSRAMQVTGYIYSHTKVINIMKEFTKREIVRPAKTRFATSYITLQSIHKVKQNLRTMFANDKWKNSYFSKEAKGKGAEKIMFMTSFWNDVRYALKLTALLVRVLRLVDNEKKPAMGYIYEAMDRAKEAIAASFGGETNVDKYNEAFKYIDGRWEVQLHRPLHAAGYYLNPAFYYDNKDHIQSDEEVQKGLYDVIVKLVDTQLHDVILKELSSYRNASGLFGIQLAKDSRKTKSPADWWECFGASAPNLQRLAIRILSLTCSSSGCERNWSAFEQIHTKKRNKLDHQRLNDLAFIKYNQKMMERYEAEDVTDPINLFDVGESNEWLLGEFGEGDDNADNELVSDGDNLTWGDVVAAIGAEEPLRNMRSMRARGGSNRCALSRHGGSSSRASGSTARGSNLDEEEEEEEFDSENEDSEEMEEDANLVLEDEDDDNALEDEDE